MGTVILILFFLLFPVLVIYLCHKYPTIDKIGAVIFCYAAGILIGNVGLLPSGSGKTIELIMTIAIPLSLPLLLFSMDIRKWSRLAGKTLFSMFLATLSIVIVSFICFMIFKDSLPEGWKIAGMLMGCLYRRHAEPRGHRNRAQGRPDHLHHGADRRRHLQFALYSLSRHGRAAGLSAGAAPL